MDVERLLGSRAEDGAVSIPTWEVGSYLNERERN